MIKTFAEQPDYVVALLRNAFAGVVAQCRTNRARRLHLAAEPAGDMAMMYDDPTLTTPAIRPSNPFRRIAAIQGGFYVLTGVWPLLSIDSFQAVTGPKVDLWLVYTVGCLIAAIGACLIMAAASGRTTPEISVVAIGAALSLVGIDVIFVVRGVISSIYLLDAAAEAGLIVWWTLACVGPPKAAAARQYAHVQRLLNRGRSIQPTMTR